MSLKIQGGIVSIGTYNDNSREYNIDARGRDLSEVIRTIDTQDVVPVQEDTPQRREYCLYICPEKLKEQGIYTLDEFESMMAKASKGIASDFAAFLKRYNEQGILNFMGHSKRQIFDNCRAHFPEMRAYDYPNFAAAY